MKIGLSYSRCVRDIVEGRVDMNNVLVLITPVVPPKHKMFVWLSKATVS